MRTKLEMLAHDTVFLSCCCPFLLFPARIKPGVIESKWISKELTLVSANEYNCVRDLYRKKVIKISWKSRERARERERERTRTRKKERREALFFLLSCSSSSSSSSASPSKVPFHPPRARFERARSHRVKKVKKRTANYSTKIFSLFVFRVSKCVRFSPCFTVKK